jgi:hypothetical protein
MAKRKGSDTEVQDGHKHAIGSKKAKVAMSVGTCISCFLDAFTCSAHGTEQGWLAA